MKCVSVAVSVHALVAARGIPANAHVTLSHARTLVLRFSPRFSRKRHRQAVPRAIKLNLTFEFNPGSIRFDLRLCAGYVGC